MKKKFVSDLIIAVLKKETENFHCFDFSDAKCRGRVYVKKDLTLNSLTLELVGNKTKLKGEG